MPVLSMNKIRERYELHAKSMRSAICFFSTKTAPKKQAMMIHNDAGSCVLHLGIFLHAAAER